MAVIDELLIGLGFDYDPKEMKRFKDDVAKTNKIIGQMARVALAGAAALTAMTVASTAASDEQGKLAAEVGDTVENLDALQFALRRSGGTSEGMANTLRQLSIRAAEAARGVGSGVEAFGLLGISTTDVGGGLKSTSDLLLEVSSGFKNLSRAQQIELADKLGIRDSIRLLQQGPKAIKALTDEARELGVTTGEDAAIAADFQDSLTNVWQVVKQLTRAITRSLAPASQELNEVFTDWWKRNKDLITQKLPAFIDKATLAIKLLGVAAAAFIGFRLATHLITLVALMRGLTLATLAANAAAILLPALIAVGITALLLLMDDAKKFFEGGDSFIQSMIEKFPLWSNEIKSVAAAFATMADLTTMIFDGWSKIFDLFKSSTFDDIKGFFGNLPGFVGDATGLVNVHGGGILPEASASISRGTTIVIDKVENIIQGGADTADNIANAVFNVFQQSAEDLDSPVEQ